MRKAAAPAAKQPALERERLQRVLAGKSIPLPASPISDLSVYSSPVWDFYDPKNLRLEARTPQKLRITWERWITRFSLPAQLGENLRCYAYVRLTNSVELLHTAAKPTAFTLVGEIRCAAGFFGEICDALSVAKVCLVQSLADVRLSDLQGVLVGVSWDEAQARSRILRHLANPVVGRMLHGGPVQWTVADIDTLETGPRKEKRPSERLPEGVFRLLSNAASRDIKQFLVASGVTPVDQSKVGSAADTPDNLFLNASPKFADNLAFYETICDALRNNYRPGRGKRPQAKTNPPKMAPPEWGSSRDITLKAFMLLMSRVRMAAQIIIGLYTGARETELRLFRLASLVPPPNAGGVWILRGTVIKHRPADAALDRDAWVASPIMRDAITILRRTAAWVNSSYVWHRATNRPDGPVAYLYPHDILNSYLQTIDPQQTWKNRINTDSSPRQLYPHMMKNSLAYELRKVDCGIPAITVQLQHKSYLDRRINPTTIGYGQLDSNAVSKAVMDANLAYARDMYDPNARRTGGGAIEFNERLRTKFLGYVEQGYSEDDVIRHFVADGMPALADVGLGYCLGRRKIMRGDKEVDPPCVGSLRCNPLGCTNGIVPMSKKPIWVKLAKENRDRAEDPELFYLKETSTEMANLADSVVAFLEKEQ